MDLFSKQFEDWDVKKPHTAGALLLEIPGLTALSNENNNSVALGVKMRPIKPSYDTVFEGKPHTVIQWNPKVEETEITRLAIAWENDFEITDIYFKGQSLVKIYIQRELADLFIGEIYERVQKGRQVLGVRRDGTMVHFSKVIEEVLE